MTEVVLQGYDAKMVMLDGRPDDGSGNGGHYGGGSAGNAAPNSNIDDDEIPF